MQQGSLMDARVKDEAALLRRALRAVDAVALQVTRTPDLADLLPAVLRILVEAVGADAGFIRLLDERRTCLVLAATHGRPEAYQADVERLPVDETTLSGRAIRTGRIQTVASAEDLPDVSVRTRRMGVASLAVAPLVADGWPVGTVGLSSRAPGRFGPHEQHLLERVAHHLATAIARAQLFDLVARAKAEWQQLFDAMADGVAICDADGRMARVNRAFAALFDAGPRDLVRTPCPLDVPHAPGDEAAREVGGPRSGQRLAVNTLSLHAFDGSAAPLMHVVRDVTAERQAEAALRQQNALLDEARAEADLFGEIAHSIATSLRLDEVLDRIVEGGRRFVGVDACAIKLPDPEGRSLAGTAMSGGLSPSYRENRTALDQPHPSSVAWRERRTVVIDDFDAAPEFRRDVADRYGFPSGLYAPLLGPAAPVGVIIFTRLGQPRPFPPDAVRRAERLAGLAALAIENARLHREVAEHAARLEGHVRERTEALETASRHKSDFLAHMSHELRTPLNAILGFSGMLLEGHGGPLADKGRRYAQQVQRSGQHLLALINDVLDLSRVEAGRLELHRERVVVPAAVSAAVDLTRGLAATQGVSVQVEAAEASLTVWADPVRLHQMITNLLSNAIKFTPPGGRVTLAASAAAGAGGWVDVAVRDTGVGVAAADMERLFKPFEQLGNRPKQNHQGTGLGLALTRRLVELHGGRIRAESPGPGQGATFTLVLPADGEAAGHNVALVEDDPGVLEMVVEALRDAGHTVRTAGTVADGAGLLAARPDLLILDLALPDGSGQDLLAGLRADPATRDLPVLAISGVAGVSADELRAAGADDFLTKPFSANVLRDTVTRLLGRRRIAA